MSSPKARSQTDKIDVLMERASEALVETRYFECERESLAALALAFASHDYERMHRILMPLQEARRHKRQQAADVRKVHRLEVYERLTALLDGSEPVNPGCYLFAPPLVAADGRELRDKADAEEVPVLIIVREPPTMLGLWPIVMVGPATVRVRIEKPKRIDVPWMLKAGEALGDAAIAMVDAQEDAAGRVEHLLEFLGTLTDHEKLHQALAQACLEAQHDAVVLGKKAGKNKAAKPIDEDDEFPEGEDDEP